MARLRLVALVLVVVLAFAACATVPLGLPASSACRIEERP